ncbi:endonuclease III [Sandarakinorhabdus sp.]|uniref:endonuclease III n=1 Tax=Sandarakinorhabdus sp. TaxID=1916663 RepID=UPI00333F3FAA
MTAPEITQFFDYLSRINPEPVTELAYDNGYHLLVAVVLSAQATDVGVNKATRALFVAVKTPQQMLDLGEDGLRQHIRTIGLFNAKARHVIALSRRLVDDFGGEVPSDRDVLETLPGVGRKTANVVVSVLFGQETCAVDTHVFRVANRTGLAPGKTPLLVENAIMKRVKPPWRRNAHHWLILHGRYTCTARSPKCGSCGVADVCQFRSKVLTPAEAG